MKRVFCILLLVSFATVVTLAQDYDEQSRSIYNAAEADYAIGRIDQARQQLTDHLREFKGTTMLQSVYRLLALCAMAQDDSRQAENYAMLLLKANPYFTTTATDPQRFCDLVERIKAGSTATITTASSRAESLSEVPVPTTLITQDMIRTSGARNLQELLAAYVPGMNIVDCNDDVNIAMRGIYSNGQEKMLILLNGHRLNSYATNIAAPDFSISLEKIRQVEVLRGPASSLYGSVALTAVVNIITAQGTEVDGIQLRAGGGNYGQVRADALFGKRYFDLDIMGWASIYRADGESYFVPMDTRLYMLNDGNSTVGATGEKPTCDLGLTLKWKQLQFMYDYHFAQTVSPLTAGYSCSPYERNEYITHNGMKPSFATGMHHADLSYSPTLGRLDLKGSLTYDSGDMTQYQVLNDGPMASMGEVFLIPSELAGKHGLSRYLNLQEHTLGAQLKGDLAYMDNVTHQGTATVGIEASYFKLTDMSYMNGYQFNKNQPVDFMSVVGKGHENSYNAFAQLKHRWGPLIVNAGLRFDYKQRFDRTHIKELSPRLALIYLQPRWNMKLSYSKAFIDAPYLYRKTNIMVDLLDTISVTSHLEPESLHSLQLTLSATNWAKGLSLELNAYYNMARNLIFADVLAHQNTGHIDIVGAELAAAYTQPRYSAQLNVSWQHVTKASIFEKTYDYSFNIPKLTANAVLAWKPWKRLSLHTHLAYSGSQTAYYINLGYTGAVRVILESLRQATEDNDWESVAWWEESLKMVEKEMISETHINPRLLIQLGADYKIGSHVTLGLNIHNLLNHKYYQSGMGTSLIRQQGLWFMAYAGLRL